MQPQRVLLALLAIYYDDNSYNMHLHDWQGCYKISPTLSKWYQVLEKVGYQISDEEKQLLDGTHPAFLKEEESI